MELMEQFLIKVGNFEGFRSKPYLCPAGKLTIGFGHTDGVKKTDRVTLQQAQDLLYEDVMYIMFQLNKSFNGSFPEPKLLALTDFVFNLGIGTLQKSSFYSYLKKYSSVSASVQKLYDVKICDTIKKYNKYRENGVLKVSEGLVLRRAFETKLWLTGKIYE